MPNILDNKTDDELLAELGTRLRTYRLQRNVSVAEVASKAGLNRNTVLNAEAGKNPRLGTVIKLLRVYGRLETPPAFLPRPGISPLQLVRDKGRVRERASRRRDG